MVINSKDVKDVLSRLANDLESRENADLWAIKLRNALDEGNLEFSPDEDEDKIWDAIQFIELYAEHLSEGQYIYSADDLREYVESHGWTPPFPLTERLSP